MKKTMKALRSFRYATRMLQADDEFEASRQDARVLSAIGRATEVGVGAWLGFIVGSVLKLAICGAMLGVFALAWMAN